LALWLKPPLPKKVVLLRFAFFHINQEPRINGVSVTELRLEGAPAPRTLNSWTPRTNIKKLVATATMKH